VDALIFDCDGVLVDSETISIATEREMLSGWGLDYPFEIFVSRFVGLHNRDFHAALAADAIERGRPLPPDFADQLQARIWQRFETDLRAIEFPPRSLGRRQWRRLPRHQSSSVNFVSLACTILLRRTYIPQTS